MRFVFFIHKFISETYAFENFLQFFFDPKRLSCQLMSSIVAKKNFTIGSHESPQSLVSSSRLMMHLEYCFYRLIAKILADKMTDQYNAWDQIGESNRFFKFDIHVFFQVMSPLMLISLVMRQNFWNFITNS